ncbi:hypothetical protein NX773_03305 [Massilia solisilvae]|uniref:Sel1 repeat family protein n=1 Tax=Massilia solisilvae TaxID=1811225 RepID=A0ABT2BFA6_9BURK|nr:hypothetical protein [Massilia solisilvae]MCS0607193.1 hypothetical protein [Massilia solisilvae]
MKRILFVLMLAACGGAAADSLSEAKSLLAAKSYGEAFPVLRMLADSGNAEAKLHLGRMYWYGQGLPADRAAADALFAQAAAAGVGEAQDARTLTQRRAAKMAEITRWTAYDGADLAAGKYACPQPAIPEVSKTNDEIKATTGAYQAWSSCYNGFVADLDGPLAPAKRIPAELAVLMSEAEQQEAEQHIHRATEAAVGKVGANAQAVMARFASWEQATKAFAAEYNASAEARKKQDQITLETDRRLREGYQGLIHTSAPTGK